MKHARVCGCIVVCSYLLSSIEQFAFVVVAEYSALKQMREELKDEFQKKHGVKLGFMSAFVKATVAAMQAVPVVNAGIATI